MKRHCLRIRGPLLGLIADGHKTLDVRVGYRNIKGVAVGDEIKLSSSDCALVVTVTAIRRYQTFTEMARKENIEKILPNATMDQLIRALKDLFADNERLGVYVFEIELLDAS